MKIHIPTTQYGFIEIDVDNIAEAKELHDDVTSTFKENHGTGLSPKDWNKCVDQYLEDGTMEADCYANMNREQTAIIQEIKKSLNRIKYKEEKATYESNRFTN